MAGWGFFVFVLPVVLGAIAGVLVCFFPKLRRFASYAFLVPLLAAYGASVGLFSPTGPAAAPPLLSQVPPPTTSYLIDGVAVSGWRRG